MREQKEAEMSSRPVKMLVETAAEEPGALSQASSGPESAGLISCSHIRFTAKNLRGNAGIFPYRRSPLARPRSFEAAWGASPCKSGFGAAAGFRRLAAGFRKTGVWLGSVDRFGKLPSGFRMDSWSSPDELFTRVRPGRQQKAAKLQTGSLSPAAGLAAFSGANSMAIELQMGTQF